MVLATVSFENFIVSEFLLADFAGKRHFFYGMHDGFVFPQPFGTYKCLPALNTQVVMRDNSIVASNHVVFQSLLVKIFVVTFVVPPFPLTFWQLTVREGGGEYPPFPLTFFR